MSSTLSRHWAEFRLAMSFLTSLPVSYAGLETVRLGQAARWFPAIGLLLGLLLWLIQVGTSLFFDPWLTGVLVIIAWAVLTGALHLDGVADCGDGLLATVSPARRLEILRDPRVGGFGAVTLFLLLLLKTGAVARSAGPALILAPVWARWLMLWVARGPQARPDGMGTQFAADLSPRTLVVASVLPLSISGAALVASPIFPAARFLSLDAFQLLFAIGAACGAVWGIKRLAIKRLGGVTGDVYGLAIEVSETVLLLVMAAH